MQEPRPCAGAFLWLHAADLFCRKSFMPSCPNMCHPGWMPGLEPGGSPGPIVPVWVQTATPAEPAFGPGLCLWVPALRPAFAGHSAGMTRGGKRGRAPSSAHFSRKRVSAVRDLLEPHRLRTRLAGPGTSSGGNEVELRRLHLSSRMDTRRRPGGSPGPIRPV